MQLGVVYAFFLAAHIDELVGIVSIHPREQRKTLILFTPLHSVPYRD